MSTYRSRCLGFSVGFPHFLCSSRGTLYGFSLPCRNRHCRNLLLLEPSLSFLIHPREPLMVRGEGDRGRGRGRIVPRATTANKRKDNASANEEAGETTGKWFSTMLVQDDFLLPWEVLQWRTVGVVAILAHQQFFCRGLAFPLDSFVCGLLFSYVCQLHHLTPNAMLEICPRGNNKLVIIIFPCS